MKLYLFVFLGGGIGSLFRYFISRVIQTFKLPSWLDPLVVNVLGSITLILLFLKFKDQLVAYKELLQIGFFGAFTTFSALSLFFFQESTSGHWSYALAGLLLNIVVGIVIPYLIFRQILL